MIKINKPNKIAFAVILTSTIFLVAAFIYTLLFLYPSYQSMSGTRQAIFEKTAELERLNLLFPVYTKSKTLNKVQFEQMLPLPKRKQIQKNELAKLSRQISNKAKLHNLTLSKSNFDINSLKNPSEFISITIELKGKLSAFRPFLIDIIALEFFDSIRALSISADKNQIKHFSLKLDIKTKKDLS